MTVSEFKLVPAKMLLDKETIEAINFHCGDGDGDDSQFGEYSDGLLWVGVVTDDEGKEVYGLHLATAEYPEEGSSTLVEFYPPEDAAQSELAALREELADRCEVIAMKGREVIEAQTAVSDWARKCKAAEQRNAELQKNADRYIWLRDKSESVHQFYLSTPIWFTGVKFNPENVDSTIDAAMTKPTESGASE